jgi:hypothetical protein
MVRINIRKWFLWMISISIVVLCIVFISSGIFYLGFKDPHQKLSLHYDLCGDSIINEHNKIEDIKDNSIENIRKRQADDLDKLANRIKLIKDHEKDPTCNYILTYSYFANKNLKAAKSQYEKFKKSSDDFVGVNRKVKNMKNFDNINLGSAIDESKGE